MDTTPPSSARARSLSRLASTLVLALALAPLAPFAAAPASAQSSTWAVERFEAPDGTGMSTTVARRLWPTAETVVMARGDQFADALAAAPIAALLNAPLLLTDSGTMPRHVWEQIEHFGPSRVILMGGPAAISDNVANELVGWGVETVERVAGANRFETAARAMDFVRANGGTADPFVVRGEGIGHIGGWEDAAAISQEAARLGAPILLTRTQALPDETRAAIVADESSTVTIVGGSAAISQDVSDELWGVADDVRRVSGDSRFATSVAVANDSVANGADPSVLWLVSGTSWQDAMIAGASAGALGGVLVYVNPGASPAGLEWVKSRTDGLTQVNIVANRDLVPTTVDVELVDLANPPAPWTPPAGVSIRPSDNAAAVVAANPPGTTFVFAAGIHRNVVIEPRDRDRFTGETGAVLLGATDISAANAVRAPDGLWEIPGVAFDPQPVESMVEMDHGRDGEAIQTDLFSGSRRLTHAGHRGAVTQPGLWHLDTAGDRIVTFDDPSTLGELQLTTAPYAFASTAVGVEIDHLEIRRYATAAKVGAIDAHNGLMWNIHHVTASENHAAGVRTGSGSRVADSRFMHNGQIGITGGDHRPDGSQEPITIERNEIAFNGEVAYRWDWEAGGAKMTNTIDTIFRGNWAHHNRGAGLWCDAGCYNPTWEGNLSEHNDHVGILVEETVRATVRSNISRANGAFSVGDVGAGIWVSNSPGVELSHNVLESNRFPIMATHNGLPPTEFGALGIADLNVHHNDVRIDAYLPGLRVTTGEDDVYYRDDIVFDNNTYRVNGERAEQFWWNGKVSIQDWQGRLSYDRSGSFIDITRPATQDSGATRGPYGAP